METQVTAGIGFSDADGSVYRQLALPIVALSVGGQIDQGRTEGALEVGSEYSLVRSDGWGLRGGARVGASLFETDGAYLGIRGGPTLALAPIRAGTKIPTLTLEGLAAVGLGADIGGDGVFGAVLSLGWDEYGVFQITHGRPLREADGRPWVPVARSGKELHKMPRALASLGPELREAIGWWWVRDGLTEHASIASFLRLALELAMFGAPARLVRGALAAAQDEVRHARLCLSLAARHLGAAIVPEPLPAVRARPDVDLETLARECWYDGCLGEGAAAEFAAVRARGAREPAVRRALDVIARDEKRHAELGWQVLRWSRARPARPLREGDSTSFTATLPGRANRSHLLASHGLLAPAEFADVSARVRGAALRRLDRSVSRSAL